MTCFSRASFPVAVALWLLIGSMVVHANIGDDIDQLRHRYGSAQVVGGQVLFQHDGYSICVYFDGAHSGMEVFVRDGSIPDKKEISPTDIDVILSQESEGKTWSLMQGKSGLTAWLRSDQKLIAKLTGGDRPGDKFFTVMLNAK